MNCSYDDDCDVPKIACNVCLCVECCCWKIRIKVVGAQKCSSVSLSVLLHCNVLAAVTATHFQSPRRLTLILLLYEERLFGYSFCLVPFSILKLAFNSTCKPNQSNGNVIENISRLSMQFRYIENFAKDDDYRLHFVLA